MKKEKVAFIFLILSFLIVWLSIATIYKKALPKEKVEVKTPPPSTVWHCPPNNPDCKG